MNGSLRTAAEFSFMHQEEIVKQKLSFIRNLALVVGVVVALAFGATQAWATASNCTLPPSVTCLNEPGWEEDPDGFCSYMCEEWYYPPFGHCLIQEDCCTCPEK